MQDKNTTKVIFSKVLRCLMEEHGVTQDELSKKINVSQTTVWKWRNGAIPDGISIVKLASFFGVKEVDFFSAPDEIITKGIAQNAHVTHALKKVKILKLEKAIQDMRNGLDEMAQVLNELKLD